MIKPILVKDSVFHSFWVWGMKQSWGGKYTQYDLHHPDLNEKGASTKNCLMT